MLIICLFGALVSCDTNKLDNNTADPNSQMTDNTDEVIDNNSLQMSDEIKRNIQLAFLEKVYGTSYKEYSYMPEDVPIELYGKFDDAYCVMLWDKTCGQFGIVTEVIVAGEKFIYETPNVIQVYFDGVLYGLAQAYENGILDESEIAELCNNYNETYWGDDEPSELTEEIKREIQITRLTAAHGANYEENGYTPEQVGLNCYGIFDNAYCVVLQTPGITMLGVSTKLQVGGYEFEFGAEVMRVYFEGELYVLDEAYESGILDDAEIAELYDYYRKSNWYK